MTTALLQPGLANCVLLVAVQDVTLLLVKRVRYLQQTHGAFSAWVKAEAALVLRMLDRVYAMCHFAQHLGSGLQAGSPTTNGQGSPSQLAEELVKDLNLDKFWMCLYLTGHTLPDHGKGG